MFRRPEPSTCQKKPPRLPERHVVTIIAGFRSVDGIVLCGDTQETVAGLSKRHVTKVRVEPEDGIIPFHVARGSNLAAAFCGAGNNGAFIDALVRKTWEAVAVARHLGEAPRFAEEAIKATYKEYGRIFQRGYCPYADIIYGIKMNGDSRLFHASGAIVNPVETYYSAGSGYYMADFLSSRIYTRELDVTQCAILSAYVLSQAKEHVDGCGGESHIAVLRNDSNQTSGIIDQSRVRIISEMTNRVDRNLASLLLGAANLRPDDVDDIFPDMALDVLKERIQAEREQARRAINYSSRLDILLGGLERDELGFVKPLTSETSEDQP